jgi:hypothetical protein
MQRNTSVKNYNGVKLNTTPSTHCAPGINNGVGGCLSKENMQKILYAYNQTHPGTPIRGIDKMNKRDLWMTLNTRLRECGGDERCWMQRTNTYGDTNMVSHFKPEKPDGQYSWLSTDDIYKAMKQYEKVYPDFAFLGPVPLNFSDLSDQLVNGVKNLDLNDAYRNGIRRIGIVFNESPWYPSQKVSGSHWVALWIDLNKKIIAYFDSYGCKDANNRMRTHCIPDKIDKFINKLRTQNPNFKFTKNEFRHQFKDSECGMYCMAFIMEALNGKDVEQIFRERKSDEIMNSLRDVLFAPPVSRNVVKQV